MGGGGGLGRSGVGGREGGLWEALSRPNTNHITCSYAVVVKSSTRLRVLMKQRKKQLGYETEAYKPKVKPDAV